jgi:glycosyltransferase involved in cell wall biosynthesis
MDNNQNLLVSVIIPAYNLERYVPQFWRAIESVVNQTYRNLEVIIVDDKSTDGTWSLLEQAAAKDSRIKIYKNTHNKGLGGVLNECLEHATGDLIARMDCDDSIDYTKLGKQVDFLRAHPEVVAVGTDLNIVDANNNITGQKLHATTHAELVKGMYRLAALAHATVMVRADVYKAFKYDETLPHGEDVALYFHFEKYGQLANIPEKLYNYWINTSSNNFASVKRTLYYTLIARWRVAKTYQHQPNLIDIFYNLGQACLYLLPNFAIKYIYTQLRLKPNFAEVIRYGLVGIATVIIDVASYMLLVHWGMNYLVADVANIPVFLSFNYFAHKWFTFKSSNRKAPEVLRYLTTFSINQLEALVILWVVVSVFGLDVYMGKVAQTVLIPLTNFFLLKFFVYRS